MAHATLKMNGKEFVLVPKVEYRRLKQNGAPRFRPSRKTKRTTPAQRDAGDIAEAKRRLAAGNFKPYSELRGTSERDRRDGQYALSILKKWRSGKLRTISHDQLKRKLGL